MRPDDVAQWISLSLRLCPSRHYRATATDPMSIAFSSRFFGMTPAAIYILPTIAPFPQRKG